MSNYTDRTEQVMQATETAFRAYDRTIERARRAAEAYDEENLDAAAVRAWATGAAEAAQQVLETAYSILRLAAEDENPDRWTVHQAEEALRWAREAQQRAAEAGELAQRVEEREREALRRRVEERERLFDALADVLYAERQYRLAREHADSGFDNSARDLAAEASSKLDEALGVARELVGAYPTDKYATRALDMGLVLRMELDRYTEALEEGEA